MALYGAIMKIHHWIIQWFAKTAKLTTRELVCKQLIERAVYNVYFRSTEPHQCIAVSKYKLDNYYSIVMKFITKPINSERNVPLVISSNVGVLAKDILIPGKCFAQCIKAICWLSTIVTDVCKLHMKGQDIITFFPNVQQVKCHLFWQNVVIFNCSCL